jgi:hypothetical protein
MGGLGGERRLSLLLLLGRRLRSGEGVVEVVSLRCFVALSLGVEYSRYDKE